MFKNRAARRLAERLKTHGPRRIAEPVHLRFCDDWNYAHDARHPQAIMRELGIKYQHATPQSICDQWWFWNCTNLPNELPKFLTVLELDPMKQIGYGLSLEDAQKIVEGPAGKPAHE